jgi:hypothetical protein
LTEIGGRYALIVAVADYRDEKLRKLRAPLADAERLGAVLKDPDVGGFDVEVATDEDEPKLKRRIARFVSNRRPEDLLLIHFSCHGVKAEGGELYLAAQDTEVGHMLSATGIAASWLNEQIGRTRAKRVVVMLDCCFGGSFPFGMHARAGEDVNVQQHLQGRGRAVITASSAMEYAYEGDELSGQAQPSIFTDAVVEGLESGKADRDGDKLISVDDLYDYVYERVKDTTPSQNPTKMSTLEGPLYLARSVYEPPIEPAKPDDRLVEAVESPFAAVRLGATQELAKLLSSKDPAVALAAQSILEQMLDDDSLKVSQAAREALPRPEQQSEPPTLSRQHSPAMSEPMSDAAGASPSRTDAAAKEQKTARKATQRRQAQREPAEGEQGDNTPVGERSPVFSTRPPSKMPASRTSIHWADVARDARVLGWLVIASGLATVGTTFRPWYLSQAIPQNASMWSAEAGRPAYAAGIVASVCITVAMVAWTSISGSKLKARTRRRMLAVGSTVSLIAIAFTVLARLDPNLTFESRPKSGAFAATLASSILMAIFSVALWVKHPPQGRFPPDL